MSDFFEQVVRENPQAQILINLSSGTPQMKMILAQLALNNRYNDRDIVGVQVRNPDKRSGDSDRTNKKNYSVEEELELNEDEEPDGAEPLLGTQALCDSARQVSAQMRSLLARRGLSRAGSPRRSASAGGSAADSSSGREKRFADGGGVQAGAPAEPAV